MTREQVYGRRAVREALRGRREVLELWATERATSSEQWLRDGPRLQVKPERELTDAAANDVAGPGRRRMHAAFRTSSEHELAFWDSAWRGA